MRLAVLSRAVRSVPTSAFLRRARTMSSEAGSKKIIHWDSQTCPFAVRLVSAFWNGSDASSWIVLKEKGLDFEIKHVDLSNKGEDFNEEYASIVGDRSVRSKIPILEDVDGTRLVESLVICEYLEEKYPSPPLWPASAALKARGRAFVEVAGAALLPAVFSLLSAPDEAVREAKAAALPEGLDVLDHALAAFGEGEGPFLFGEKPSIADIALLTVTQRASVVLPHYRNVDFAGLVAERPRLQAWLEAGLAWPSVKETTPADDVIVVGYKKFVK